MDIPKRLRKEVEELETKHRQPKDEREREKRLKEVREAAEQENRRYLQELVRERRGEYVRRVGVDNVTSEALRDENYLTEDDVPPFEITESGEVFSSRDGKPITTYHQTLAEPWYWQEVEWGGPGLVHDEEAEAFYTREGELAISRDRVDLQHYLNR